MAKPSSYWQERFNDLNENLLNKGEDYNLRMISAYDEAAQNIQKEIEVFYERFAGNNLMSLSDAKKILNSDERKAFHMSLEEYIEYGKQNALDGKWIKELESASDIYRMDRLKALQLQMRQQVEILEAKKATGLTEVLGKIYEDGYYHTIYEIQKGLEVGSAFATLDTNRIEKVIAKPWAPDGKNFSQKIWGADRTNLLYQLDTKFTQAIIRGDAPNRVIKEMANTLNVSKSAASRLVMTESAYVASASRLDGYKALDVEEFKYVATLDNRTSSLCQSMDGQHFPMSQYEVGVNAPPLHPWCRSTTVPYFDDEFTQNETRAARGEDGKTYYVDGNMTYKDWHDKYVDNTKESGIIKESNPYSKMLSERKIVGIDDTVRSLEPVGQPNSIADLVKESEVKQRRIYGNDGKAIIDIDTSNHKKPKYHPMGAHKHEYDYSKNNPHGKADYFTNVELEQNKDIIQKGENYHDNRSK